jgi:uncharacterized protein (DUF2147 family)
MKKAFPLISFLLFLLVSVNINAQDIAGKWKTIDDQSGKVRSIVEITKEGSKYFGKITELFLEPDEVENPPCTECSGQLKGQPILGMQIINGLTKSGDEFSGEILDPEDGKVYKCKLWLENGQLKVRGYVLFLYRTQTWLPLSKADLN